MKILATVLLSIFALSVSAQERPYYLISCFSDSEGWIEVLVNKKQENDQLLRIYSQAGLGPNSLEASYTSVGNNNRHGIDRGGKIYLEAAFSAGLKLAIYNSVAELSSNLNVEPVVYKNCRLSR